MVLLDEVCVATDSYGNSYVINPDERTWVSENTVTVFKFYDAGIRDNRHYYEVHMSSQVFDSYYYYTYHTFQIKPSGNSEWWTHKQERGGEHENQAQSRSGDCQYEKEHGFSLNGKRS